MSVTGLIVNRVQPRFADDAELDELADLAPMGPVSPFGQLVENLRGYTAASDREERAYADLVDTVAPAPVYRIPLLNSDVHDLDGLTTVAELLFREPPGPAGAQVGTEGGEHPGLTWGTCGPSSWPAMPRRCGPRWRPSPTSRRCASARPAPGPR